VVLVPLVGQPLIEFADRRRGQVRQQLREVELRVDPVAAAGAGDGTEDGRRFAAAGIADSRSSSGRKTCRKRIVWPCARSRAGR
jgi:hypothetical protein